MIFVDTRAEPENSASQNEATAAVDARLVLPALAAWVSAALTLGSQPAVRVAVGLLALASAVLIGARSGRSARRPVPSVIAERATTARVAARAAAGDPASVGRQLDPAQEGSLGRLRATPRPSSLSVGTRSLPLCSAFALALALSALCLCSSGLQGLLRSSGRAQELARARAAVWVVGRVASDPRVIKSPSRRGEDLVVVELKLLVLEGRGLRSAARGRVLVFAGRDWLSVRWGERVQARGRLAATRLSDEAVATLTARGPPTELEQPGAIARVADHLRAGLREACAGLSADARGLLPGLVVGDTSAQPTALGEDMKATGLTHLSAVSGTNITIVCAVALGLGRGAGLGRRLRLLLAGAVLFGFVVVARPEPSVLRAGVMAALGLLALAGSRTRAALPALCAAVVVLLAVDPWLARAYGFALSVLATAGLLLLAPRLSYGLSRWLPRPVAVAVAVPLAAQAACGPVVVLLAGQVSLVAVPANLLCEPLVAPATVVGLAAALASPLHPAVAAVLAHVAGWPCSLIAVTAHRLARVPGGQIPWPGGPFGAGALAVGSAVVIAASLQLVRRPPGRTGGALVVAAVLAVAAAMRVPLASPVAWPPAGWVLVACDVGQGDALVLSTAPARAILVDAGPDPDQVDGCLRRLGVRALDAVVLTHFHADHVDGLPGALRGRRAAEVVVTLVDDPPTQARDVRLLAAAHHIPVRTVAVGEHRAVGSVDWLVLGPERVVRDGSVPNNTSVVLLARSRGLRLLLLGDVELAADRLLRRRLPAALGAGHVDVLKVAHHGSALQDPAVIAAASPRVALISVGADNDYGHPAPSTLRMLRRTGAVIGRTDLQGDLAVVPVRDGLRLVVSGPRTHRQAEGPHAR